MDSTPTLANPHEPAKQPGALSHSDRTKKLRRELYRQPEIIAAYGLMMLWSFAMLVGGAPILAVVLLGLLGVVLVVLVVMSGSHAMVMMAAGYLSLLILIGIASTDAGNTALAASMSTVLLLMDLLRLNFARRRSAKVDPRLFATTLIFTVLVAVAATLSVAIASIPGRSDDELSWLFVPIASIVLLVVAGLFVFLLARKSGTHDKRRWRPGERMLPQPTID